MRILIVGSDANSYSIAQIMSKNKNIDVIFASSLHEKINEYAELINISENDVSELLDFAIANEISLTIVTSLSAISNGIADCFTDARRLIFAPSEVSSLITLSRAAAKKMMYKLKIPTMKFGIFERENQAIEYVSNYRKALLIKNDLYTGNDSDILTDSFKKAKSVIENKYISPENKIIIEDYIDAQEISLYFITDGYTALPIGSCLNKSSKVYSPDKYLTDELEMKILRKIVYPILDDIASRTTAYCGILGLNMYIDGDNFNIIDFMPFFKNIHLQNILPLIKTDLFDLFISAASGSLSDEYEYIEFNNYNVVSTVIKDVNIEKISEILDDNFSYTSIDNNNIIVTETAKTYTRAENNLTLNIEYITNRKD